MAKSVPLGSGAVLLCLQGRLLSGPAESARRSIHVVRLRWKGSARLHRPGSRPAQGGLPLQGVPLCIRRGADAVPHGRAAAGGITLPRRARHTAQLRARRAPRADLLRPGQDALRYRHLRRSVSGAQRRDSSDCPATALLLRREDHPRFPIWFRGPDSSLWTRDDHARLGGGEPHPSARRVAALVLAAPRSRRRWSTPWSGSTFRCCSA